MKTTILVFLFFFGEMITGLQNDGKSMDNFNAQKGEIAVTITYGSRSGCFGSGPCRVEEGTKADMEQSGLSGMATGYMSLVKNDRLILRVSRNSMDKKTYLQQFRKGVFYVPKSIDIPDEVSAQFNVKEQKIKLPKGNFPVSESKDGFIYIAF